MNGCGFSFSFLIFFGFSGLIPLGFFLSTLSATPAVTSATPNIAITTGFDAIISDMLPLPEPKISNIEFPLPPSFPGALPSPSLHVPQSAAQFEHVSLRLQTLLPQSAGVKFPELPLPELPELPDELPVPELPPPEILLTVIV